MTWKSLLRLFMEGKNVMPGMFWEYTPPRNQRLAGELYAVRGQPCFFTIRAAAGTRPFSDPHLAAIAVNCLLAQQAKSQCQVDVYGVMPDHVHLVVTPRQDGASSLLYVDRFKGWCSRELHFTGWRGVLWQRRSYDHLLRAEDDLAAIGTYILGNPVRSGLTQTAEAYPWSGIPEHPDGLTLRSPS